MHTSSSSESPENTIFKFIQLNLWNGRLYYPLEKFLKREQADIFSAQEVLSGEGDERPDHVTAETLGTAEYGFFGDFVLGGGCREWRISSHGKKRSEHCATFTNAAHKIESHYIHPVKPLAGEIHRNMDTNLDYFNLLHSVVALNNNPDNRINILNCHARVVIGARLGSPIVDNDFKQIAEYIAELSGPIIFSGDCNIFKEASSLDHLKALGLRNMNDIHGITRARNAFSWQTDESVSHVFINDHIDPIDYKVADDLVSDHQPLVLKFKLKS